MQGIAEAYRRWRHGRGYGVHSPFAYELVKQVVRPERGYAYYGYGAIDDALMNLPRHERMRHMKRHARILLRLAGRLGFRSAFLPKAQIAAPFITALLAANSKMSLHYASADIHRCDLVLSSRNFIPLPLLRDYLSHDGKVLCMNYTPPGWPELLFDALPQGLMLRDRKSLIIINRPQMQKISYNICI